jgi:hypothetical protein
MRLAGHDPDAAQSVYTSGSPDGEGNASWQAVKAALARQASERRN